MRLFVAVDVSAATRAALVDLRRQLEAQLRRARRPPRITWVNPAIAHVTLRFIGEVADDRVASIVAALSPPFSAPPFDVTWARIGTFPTGRAPRVIWAGATDGQDALARVAHEVNARVHSVIGPEEAPPFTAHLTMARVKDAGRGVDWPQALASIAINATSSRIDRVTLYRSRTSPAGPAYDPVGSWTLSPR